VSHVTSDQRRATISFGTEGWRGIIADDFTVESVQRLSQAIAAYFHEHAQGPVRLAVGYDTRFLSDRMAALVAEVLAGNGCEVWVAAHSSPTPALSTFVRHQQLTGGVMVTASHNPPQFNGVKVKTSDGGSIDPEATQRIEALLDQRPVQRVPWAEAAAQRRLHRVDILPAYLAGLRSFVRLASIRRAGLRVVVDAMHGTGNRLVERAVGKGRTRLTTLHAEPDPLFGGHAPEPIPRYLTELLRTTKRSRAHLGLATDGDADRIGAARPDGRFLNPGQILCVILLHLLEERGLRGGVVTTISNIAWIPAMAQEFGLKLYEVPVGFKHIAKLMREDHILIGGEESGGIGIAAYLPERDGILLGLLLMELLAMRGQSLLTILRQLERKYGTFAYGRVDLHIPEAARDQLMRRLTTDPPTTIAGRPIQTTKTYDGLKLIGRQREWILFRLSGTEPILRIYAEAPSETAVQRLLTWGKRLAHA